MRVLDSELMKGYARMAMDGFNQGWHERNGGNLSYRMKSEEVEALKGQVQKLTDKKVKAVDEIVAAKEKEILTV